MHPELNRLTYLFPFSFHSFFPRGVLGSYQNKLIVGFRAHANAAAFARFTLGFLRSLNTPSLVWESRHLPSEEPIRLQVTSFQAEVMDRPEIFNA